MLSRSGGQSGGGGDAFAFGPLLRNSWRLYIAFAARLLPSFVLIFVLVRLLIPVVVTRDIDETGIALGLTLVQVIVPVVVGSLMVAVATVVFRTGHATPPVGAVRALGPQWLSLLGSASISTMLAFLAIVLMGPIGVLIQPMFLGPPVVMHAIAVEHRALGSAWARTRQLLRGDARLPLYLLVISMVLGLAVVLLVTAADGLSAGLGGTARGTLLFAVQGAFAGATALFVAAVGFRAYETLAARADGFPGETRA